MFTDLLPLTLVHCHGHVIGHGGKFIILLSSHLEAAEVLIHLTVPCMEIFKKNKIKISYK